MATTELSELFNITTATEIIISEDVILDKDISINGRFEINEPNTSIYLPPINNIFVNNMQLSSALSTGGAPIGSIAIWYSTINTIPIGWAICDGTFDSTGKKRPDLRGRFVICSNSVYDVNVFGGSSTKVLAAANLPSHNHNNSGTGNFTTNTGGGHNHGTENINYDNSTSDFNDIYGRAPTNGTTIDPPTNTSGSHSHALNSTNSSGGSQSFQIMPPYYALIYIIKEP
jgi:microcystin-dependent protein